MSGDQWHGSKTGNFPVSVAFRCGTDPKIKEPEAPTIDGKRSQQLPRQFEIIRRGTDEEQLLAWIKGSHHIFTKTGQRERIVIPIHEHQPLKIGLLKSLMKIAGLGEGDL